MHESSYLSRNPNAATAGTLHFYAREFGLWATHSRLDCKACHTYQQNATSGDWYVRHKQCAETRPANRLCCQTCEVLGEPKNVQRLVVTFTRNFVAAQLLCRKLYFTPAEVDEYIQEIEATAFGRFNGVLWGKVKAMNLIQLQAFVVNTYQSFPEHLKTQHLKHFLQTVVNPCLKVNVTNIDEALAPLATKFVQALANRRLSDAWLRDFNLTIFVSAWDFLDWSDPGLA